MKKLCKSQNKMFGGVCSGFAEYFGIDATVFRLLVVVLTLCGVIPGVVAYLICFLLMPEADFATEKAGQSTTKHVEDDVSNLKSANINPDENNSSSNTHSDEDFNSYFKEEK